jgi:hypothetical protein
VDRPAFRAQCSVSGPLRSPLAFAPAPDLCDQFLS